MSFTTENIVKIVKSSPEASAAIFNCMHNLSSGFQAMQVICKEHDIKKPRKGANGYGKPKRPPSPFNLFTSMNKDNKKLILDKNGEKLPFAKRAGVFGAAWKKLSTKERKKYEDLSAEYKAEAKKNKEEAEEEKKPAKNSKKKNKKPEEVDDADSDNEEEEDVIVDSDVSDVE